MSWVKEALTALRQGREIDICPFGGSMRGKIESGQRVTLQPVNPNDLVVGDVVFVQWKNNFLLHLVKELTETHVLIGTNIGKINGWELREAVLGRVTKIHVDENGSHPTG